MFPRRLICTASLIAFFTLFLAATPVFGQSGAAPRSRPNTRSELAIRKTSDTPGYEYAFDDDPLDANPNMTTSLTIVTRGRSPHVALIRPRVQFVPEMLKSVEAL